MPAAALRCPPPAERAELYRDACRTLYGFVRTFWGIVEPAAPFSDNWHIGATCEFLEAWYRREFSNGVLNMPPGTGKSLLVDVMLDAWVWSLEPGHRFLCCAYDEDLCLRDAGKVQAICGSPAYRLAFPGSLLRDGAGGAKGNVWTLMGGNRFATSPQGRGGTGRHFHSVSINDPVNPKHIHATQAAEFGVGLANAQQWIDTTMPTRRADPKRFGAMLTMQRLVERDPAGIALERDGWTHLCLPMRYTPRAHWIHGDWSARVDPRTEPAELLHSARWDEKSVREVERALGDHAAAQLDQNPIPRTGGLLEEQHLRYEWVEPPARAGSYWIQVWDFAAKGTEATHSAVHGALWCAAECDTWYELSNTLADRERGEEPTRVLCRGEKQTRYFLIDEVWGIWTVPESERQFELAQELPRWDDAHARIIEAKAAGIGIIQRYERKFAGVIAFHEINDECKELAQLGKLDRHRASLGEYHAGRVLLPRWKRTLPDPIDGRDGPGPDAFRKELLSFPRGARDDRVDTSSMALARLGQITTDYYEAVRQIAAQLQRRGDDD